MTIGDKIRKIRQEQGLSITELAKRIGCNESYIRAYETGRRNPKPKSLEKIADALGVNVNVLSNSQFDGIQAMTMLFQIFMEYGGTMFEYEDEDETSHVAVTFDSLRLMPGWLEVFKQYEKDLKAIDPITDPQKRYTAFKEASRKFHQWMDFYPNTETNKLALHLQKQYDERMAYIDAHSPEEKPEEMKKNTYFNEHSYTEMLGKKPPNF